MEKSEEQFTIKRDSLTESIWQKLEQRLSGNQADPGPEMVYDALIVGAGITGVTLALLLQKAGKKCILADANTIAFGTTAGTTAHLNTFFDSTYPEIESAFGADAAKLVAKGGQEALDLIKELIDLYEIDCDFEHKNGFLFSENEEETKMLKEILTASKEAGVTVEETNQNGVPLKFEKSLQFRDQAQFHPLKYLAKLMAAYQELGGLVLENTLIESTTLKDDIHFAKAGDLTLKVKNVVYATHIPPGINLLSLRCAPYRSYVLGIKLADNAYPDCLAYDMKEPYHYFRSHVVNGEKYLILGGEDHKTGHDDPTAAFEKLTNYAKTHYNVESIPFQWSAQYYVPVDGLPYIGQLPGGEDRIYVATGYNGNGMQFGTLSAKIIAALIVGDESEYADLFRPSRLKPIAGFTEFVKENADVAYRFVADRFSSAQMDSLNELQPEEGKIVTFDNQKLAVYKAKNGEITALNPVCTHAKCIVCFNPEEKSWDCPCHGGRFDLDGKVLTGPPRTALEKIDLTK
jgi:glycine/D-amino acid oxidase-like deaminating enzyme/nitrite reductase/ring-hydroxylating ferredoxin subunit